jgi:hypothetical protein
MVRQLALSRSISYLSHFPHQTQKKTEKKEEGKKKLTFCVGWLKLSVVVFT